MFENTVEMEIITPDKYRISTLGTVGNPLSVVDWSHYNVQMHLYRSRDGWIFLKIKREKTDYRSIGSVCRPTKIIVSLLGYIVIPYNQAKEIHTIYDQFDKVPVKEWVSPFGFVPSKSNGAAKAFCGNFKKDFYGSMCKTNNVAYCCSKLGTMFELIARDYLEWNVVQKALLWNLIWRFRKEALPRIPKDIMILIRTMILED